MISKLQSTKWLLRWIELWTDQASKVDFVSANSVKGQPKNSNLFSSCGSNTDRRRRRRRSYQPECSSKCRMILFGELKLSSEIAKVDFVSSNFREGLTYSISSGGSTDSTIGRRRRRRRINENGTPNCNQQVVLPVNLSTLLVKLRRSTSFLQTSVNLG